MMKPTLDELIAWAEEWKAEGKLLDDSSGAKKFHATADALRELKALREAKGMPPCAICGAPSEYDEFELVVSNRDYNELRAHALHLAEWKLAIDHALVVSLQTTTDSYQCPSEALGALVQYEIVIATDPKVNGGKILVDEQEYLRLKAERNGK
jgi:hypothetical protein